MPAFKAMTHDGDLTGTAVNRRRGIGGIESPWFCLGLFLCFRQLDGSVINPSDVVRMSVLQPADGNTPRTGVVGELVTGLETVKTEFAAAIISQVSKLNNIFLTVRIQGWIKGVSQLNGIGAEDHDVVSSSVRQPIDGPAGAHNVGDGVVAIQPVVGLEDGVRRTVDVCRCERIVHNDWGFAAVFGYQNHISPGGHSGTFDIRLHNGRRPNPGL
ncbi:hypothetical protein ES703_74204 [subsurface metagenome]